MELMVQKQSFEQLIHDILYRNGFEKIENGYEINRIVRQPDKTMVVNGQQTIIPSKPIQVSYKITYEGDGYLMAEDETIERNFTQIKFESFVNNESQGSYEECMYWDEPDRFEQIFNSIMR